MNGEPEDFDPMLPLGSYLDGAVEVYDINQNPDVDTGFILADSIVVQDPGKAPIFQVYVDPEEPRRIVALRVSLDGYAIVPRDRVQFLHGGKR